MHQSQRRRRIPLDPDLPDLMEEISSPDYDFGGFRLDKAQQVLVSPTGEPLPSRAFATPRYLVERAGEIVDKSALMSWVWPTTVVAENNLNQCIWLCAKRRWPGVALKRSHWNIAVPPEREVVSANVLVVPRVVFDAARYRLGYGGGFYDRTLAAATLRPYPIGIAFADAELPTIYPQPHDIRMDVIVTERSNG